MAGSTTLTTGESTMRSQLLGAGFNVTVRDDDTAATADATGASVVVISSSVTSALIGTKFRTANAGMIVMEPALLDDMGMMGPRDGADYGIEGGETQLTIPANVATPLWGGLTGTVSVTWTGQDFTWGAQPTPFLCAKLIGSSTRCGIFGYPTGDVDGQRMGAGAARGFLCDFRGRGEYAVRGLDVFPGRRPLGKRLVVVFVHVRVGACRTSHPDAPCGSNARVRMWLLAGIRTKRSAQMPGARITAAGAGLSPTVDRSLVQV